MALLSAVVPKISASLPATGPPWAIGVDLTSEITNTTMADVRVPGAPQKLKRKESKKEPPPPVQPHNILLTPLGIERQRQKTSKTKTASPAVVEGVPIEKRKREPKAGKKVAKPADDADRTATVSATAELADAINQLPQFIMS